MNIIFDLFFLLNSRVGKREVAVIWTDNLLYQISIHNRSRSTCPVPFSQRLPRDGLQRHFLPVGPGLANQGNPTQQR
jgi:hypothetical protein